MTALYRTATIRRIEQDRIAALGGGVLMARAAAAVADATARLARARARATPVVALVGPGNNGGDALLALALLRERGFPVHALALSEHPPAADDARAVWEHWHARGGSHAALATLGPWLDRGAILIDGLFGIGLARALDGDAANAALAAAEARVDVVAVDVPSGLDAETGAVVGGADAVAVRALRTVTMIGDKPGLHTGRAADHVGALEVAPLGIVASAGDPPPDGRLFGEDDAAALRPHRPRDSHKGSFGSVVVVGGAAGTQGAALLAALGAQAVGAGKVFVASPDGRVFDPGQPQLMTRALDAPFAGDEIVCAGCGLGRSAPARHALERALRSPAPIVVDADALNLVAEEPALSRRLAARAAASILTPHPLEAARLLGAGAREVQSDRLGAALALATSLNACVVLKGAGSVVATPAGAWSIVASGAPALATAGTGDVLAGVIAALLAQRVPAPQAACLGAWLHGRAGELWQLAHPYGAGLSAAQLPALVASALNALPSRPSLRSPLPDTNRNPTP